MKRKVALVLAAVLGISVFMPATVTAATDNFVDNKLSVPGNTLLYENGMLGTNYLVPNPHYDDNNDEPEWYVDGTDLVLPLQDRVANGYEFKLLLNNAKWFFRAAAAYSSTDVRTSLSALTTDTIDSTTPIANKDFTGLASAAKPGIDYDPDKGYYAPNGGSSSDYGNYYRAGGIKSRTSGSTTYYEIPYKLAVSALNNSNATVTILGDYENTTGRSYEIRIPLVTLVIDDNVDVTVEIDSGNKSAVTSQKILYAASSKNQTKASCTEVAISRDEFEPGDVVITELRPGTIRPGEIIKLSLPYGYHFSANWGGADGDVDVGVEPGLAWRNNKTGYGTYVARGSFNRATDDYTLYFPTKTDYNDKLSGTVYYDEDKDSELWIELGNTFMASNQLKGSIYISNLVFWADDDAPMPSEGKSIDIKLHVDGEDNITEEDVLIAQRVDWAVSLKTTNTVPTLVSGRYIGPSWSGVDADDNTHKTAHVQMYESTSNAWWSSRTTVLSLPATDNNTVKGAKFRKIKITDTSNLGDYASDLKAQHPSSMYGLSGGDIGSGVYLNDGEKHGYVSVNDNKITLSSIRVNQNKKATIDFDLWVSVELGFGKQTGDLKLSIDPSSTSLTGSQESYSSVVIAHIVDPITVTTKVSDLKIGYQYQPTADIQITENGKGYLLKNKTVRISITDLINSDMWFTPDTKVQVTSGDMKIKNVSTTGIGGFTSQSQSWLSSSNDTASIAFDIERESSAASTVTISNVAVKLDRTVPVTNKQSYQAIVWGTAVAENFGLTSDDSTHGKRTWKADFNTAGIYSPYINVISSPNDQGSILSQEVRVTIGENYYTVNGTSYSMPAAAYISAASHSTLVPLRFVANAFGLRDENQIVWDDTNKTATIFAPSRTVQFTLNKSTMIVDGVSITMFSPDNLPVMAEIKGDRMYIPFRALGQAFGVPVTWDTATQTAIYNEGANTNTNAAVTNNAALTPAPSVTPAVSATPTVTP
ncbi:MAG: copper amine oxidase N-terminal domain-containing protein [Clostridiales bacterium]|jgi:hypothetical protein|nr:copper amine oxidase N-terminal domain-containing protein [Clostridiales bacterium]